MNDDSEVEDILLLLGTTLFFSCTEHDANFKNIDEESANALSCHPILEDQQQNTLSVKSFVKDKAIEMYARKGLEEMKKKLRSSEPVIIGSIDKERVNDKDIEVTFQLKNIKLYNLSSFQVKKFKSLSEQSTAEFSVELPFIKAIANYEINGTFKEKKVNGQGASEINVTGVSIDDGKVIIKETPQEIQITSLNMCYNFKDLSIKQSGLNIEGLPSIEVTKFLNDSGNKYLRDNRKKICDRIAREMKNRINAKLRGKNRDQLMGMMKGM